MLVDDNRDLSLQLNPAQVIRINGLVVLNRWELHYSRIQEDITMPNFNMPESYTVQGKASMGLNGVNQEVHHSRILRFDGVKLPRLLHVTNNYWGDSIFSRLYNPLRNYQSSYDSAAAALQDFSVSVYKIKELANLISSGQEEVVKKRLQIVEMSKSLIRAMILDSEEEFTHQTRTLTGVPEILEKMKERLAASTKIPSTVLFGDSPTGLGGSGRHEQTNWYDYVSAQQELILTKPLKHLLKIVLNAKQGPTNGKEEKGWDFEYCPLWQMDQKEEIGMKKTQAEVDTAYIQNGVLDPSEVAVSRFGGNGYSYETTIDLKMRDNKQVEKPEEGKEENDGNNKPQDA
jgi:phage-related protein (TIGR01555 family)